MSSRSLPRPLAAIGLKLFGLPLQIVPYTAQRPVLELALNQVFADQKADGDLADLEGRSLCVHFTDIDRRWQFGLLNDRIVTLDLATRPDVTISGQLAEFLLLITQTVDPDTLFFQRRLSVEGDTEMGLYIKNLLDSMDWSGIPETAILGLEMLANHRP